MLAGIAQEGVFLVYENIIHWFYMSMFVSAVICFEPRCFICPHYNQLQAYTECLTYFF